MAVNLYDVTAGAGRKTKKQDQEEQRELARKQRGEQHAQDMQERALSRQEKEERRAERVRQERLKTPTQLAGTLFSAANLSGYGAENSQKKPGKSKQENKVKLKTPIGEIMAPASWVENVEGYQNWLHEYDQILNQEPEQAGQNGQAGENGQAGSGQNGGADAGRSYRKRQKDTIDRMQQDAENLRAFYNSHRDIFGDEFVDHMLDTMDSAQGNLKTIRDSARAEDGYQYLIEGCNRYMDQIHADAQDRDGVWQDPDDFEDYRRTMTGQAAPFQQEADWLRRYYSANRDLYGDETVDRLLNQLDSMDKSFQGVQDDLQAEGKFRGQFADRYEFDAYRFMAAGDVEGMEQLYEGLNDHIDSLNREYLTYTGNDWASGYNQEGRQKIGQELHQAKKTRYQVKKDLDALKNKQEQAELDQKLEELEQDPEAARLYKAANSIGTGRKDAIRALEEMGYDYDQLHERQQAREDAARILEEQSQLEEFLASASLEELAQRNEELGEQISGINRVLRERTRTGLSKDPEGTRAYCARLQDQRDRAQQEQNMVLNRYYELDNEEKLAALEQDPETANWYQSAKDIQADMDKVAAVMAYVSGLGGDPAKAEADKQYLFKTYGLDQKAVDQYAIYGANGSYVPRTDGGYNNIYDLYLELQEKQRAGVEKSGYDYNRLTRYRQAQEDAARYAEEQEKLKEEAKEHPWLYTASARIATPFQALDAVDMAIRSLTQGSADDIENYEPLNVYNMDATNYVSGITGAVSEQLAEEYPYLEIAGVNVPAFLYQTGTSMVDSAAHYALGPAGLAFMGSEAAAHEMQDIIARGGNNQQVLWGGTAAGIAEALFEKVSMDRLLQPRTITGWVDLLKNAGIQGLVELSEEELTEAANILSDAAIMGRDSRSALAAQDYVMNGMSEEKARQQVFYDNIGQVMESGIGGWLSGFTMAGTHSAVNYALGGSQYRNAGQQLRSLGEDVVLATVQEGLDSPEGTLSYDLARKLQAKLAAGKTVSDTELGQLYQANVEQIKGEAQPPDTDEVLQQAAMEMEEDSPLRPYGPPLPEGEVKGTPYRDGVQDTDSPRRFAPPPSERGAEGQLYRDGVRGTTIPSQATPDSPFQKGPEGPRYWDGVQVAAEQARAMVEASEIFGENGQKAFDEAWDGQTDSGLYYAGFAAWYQAGLTGKARSQVRGPYAGYVNEAQRSAAYDAGQKDAALSLAKEKAAAPYARTAGDEAEFVRDDYVIGLIERGELDIKTADRMDAAARALGVRAYMVDDVAEGQANGGYSGSDILIAKDAADPVARVFGHELAHRMQELAPEQFRVFRQAALDNLADSAALAKIDNYRAQGMTIQYEAAMNDVTADYAGQLMEDGRVLDEFIERHRTDRTLLEKLRDAFRSLWQKLTGAERRKAQTAEGKLAAALDAAAEQADSLSLKDSPSLETDSLSQAAPDSSLREGAEGQGEVKYSLKEYNGKDLSKDGSVYTYNFLTSLPDMKVTSLPEVDTVRDSNKKVDARAVLEMGMKNARAVGTERDGIVLVRNSYTGKQLQITGESIRHGLNGSMNRFLTNARLGAVIGDLVQNAVPINALQDKASGVTGTYAMAGYATDSAGREFVAILTVEQRTGRVVDLEAYDMLHAVSGRQKKSSQASTKLQGLYPIKAADITIADFLEAVNSTHQSILPQDVLDRFGETRNPKGDYTGDVKFSLKGATITRSYNQLLRENDALRERAEYWRGQTKTTKTVTTDRKSVAAAAKSLLKEYGVQMDEGELGARLQKLYDAMATGKDGGNEIGPAYAWEQAETIARDIAGSAVEEWSLNSEFPGLKEKLRTTPLSLGSEFLNDMRNEDFRKQYRGKLKISVNGKTNVDMQYAVLSEAYPGLFPADITHPADQLEQIMSVADSLYDVEEYSRFSGNMEEAVTGITNEIMEGFFDLPQTKTFADRQAEKLALAKAHGQNRVAETREQYQAKMQQLRQENRQAVQQAVQRERDVRQRQLQALKDRYAQSRESARGRRADSKARDRLLHIAKRLQNAKLPEVNRTLLNEYIGDLDTVAKSMTGKTLNKLRELRDWYDDQKANNPDFLADPKIEKDLARLSKRQIGDLSSQEVADLTQVLLNIENEIRTQRKLIDSQERRDVYAAGEATIRDIEASAGSKPTGLWSLIDKGIITETLSPLRQVRRMTGYTPDSPLTKVTQELADGQRAMFDYQMKAEAQFAKYTGDKGFTKAFAGPKARGIQIQGMGKDGPTTVTITPAMRASLWLHSLNDQNLKHIRDGGVTVPDWKLYQKGQIAEAYARGTTIRLTPSQVRHITANMTQKERAFALAAHRYFNVTSKEAINAVSEKLKGYSIAQEENYFPIRTDSSFTRADFEAVKFDGTIEGMGFLKERINAGNPILLRDMSAELDQSIQMHSKYAGLAIPVRNFNKLWNVTTGQWVDGGLDAGYNGSEGGENYGDQLGETAGNYRRSEDPGEDAGRTGSAAGADREGPGRIAAWAEGAQVQNPGEPAGKAVKIVQSYGVRAVVVQEAAIRGQNPGAVAMAENGVVYLPDTLAEDDAKSVAHHEIVHVMKQLGSAAYEDFLGNTGGELDFRSDRLRDVINLVTDSRFPGQEFMSLTPAQQRTVFDELNAVVWGCYKEDARNARAQFEDVFQDYDGYIKTLKGIMEGESARLKEENARAGARAEAEAHSSRRFEYTGSVKSAVKGKWGEAGYSYIEKMMSDLQNGHKPTKAWSKAMNKLRSNYAGAVLTLNASVAMKQAASYPTAAAVLGWGPLAKAMKNFGKVDLDLIAKYTPLQWYRSKGFSTQELGDMATANRQLPRVLNWVQGVDLITTRKLWKASEYYVQAHNKALNRGTDAYYRAVADIYNQVIEETQPNYTTMQRPQLLRSDDSLLANLQMFKTQPFQNTNILYAAAGEFTAARRRGDREQIKSARAKLGRAVTSQLAQLAVFAGMGMVWAMFRGKKKKYEDEDGEMTLESTLSALGKDMAGGALAGIPFGSDAWELLSSKLFGENYYGLDAVTVQALGDTIQSLGGLEELIEGTVKAASAGEEIDWRSAGIRLDGYLDDISKAAGVPYENVANLVYAIQRQVAVKSLGELQGEYAAMKWTVDPKKSGEYYDLLYKALEQGDLDSYFTIREELPELLGKDHSDIDGAMKSRYKDKLEKNAAYSIPQESYDLLGIRPGANGEDESDSFGADDLDAGAYQTYTTQRAADYREAEDALADNPIFKGMDQETRDKVLQAAFDMTKDWALEDASDGQYKTDKEWIAVGREAEKKGIEPWEYSIWNVTKNDTTDVKDENGKKVKGETRKDQLSDWLKMSDLSEDQREFLWGTEYNDGYGNYRDDLADYRVYGPQMDAAYDEMTGGLADDPIFVSMDKETREKVTDAAMKVAKQRAQAEVVEDFEYDAKWIENTWEAEEQGIALEDYVLWHVVAESTKSDYGADDKPIKGREKQDKLRDWLNDLDGLTYDQKLWLWRTKYSPKTPF